MKAMRPAAFLLAAAISTAAPVLESEFIFPLEHWHNHSSSLVELPNGDLFVVWYKGSGERTADDVKVEAARLRKGRKEWDPRFTLTDTPGFPDCNPAAFVDSKGKLWLFWPVILANEWHTALLKYKVSSDYLDPGRPPRWEVEDNLLFHPRNFAPKVASALASLGLDNEWARRNVNNAADKYFSRMGWMPRAHPIELPSGRIILPLYSDGFDFSLMALTDDRGRNWTTSEPLVSYGGIQPAIARRKDGSLVTFMRDNGPAPKRMHYSESKDEGVTWSPVTDSEFPNPGSGSEIITLRNGNWVLIYNDLEKGRYSLAVSLSEDEGKTWPWKRRLEFDDKNTPRGEYHYPSLIETRDGMLHASYSYFLNHVPKDSPRKTIKHARFNIDWIKSGR